MRRLLAAGAATATALAAAGLTALVTGTAAAAPANCTQVLFDDFNYSSSSDANIAAHGWTVRTNSGGPGIPGASWPASNITFPTVDGAKSLQLTSKTDGTAGGTSQSEFLQGRRFFEGTYAARVKFADAPESGNDGDHIVETLFTITPLNAPLDPNYGEIDFEYLPNGGWGETGPIFYQTTWETYQEDPWQAVNTHTEERSSYNGWHDLMFQVSAGHVKYYVDGVLIADHSGIYYPETPMSVNFNLWFIDSAAHTGGLSTYRQSVDYFYHSVGNVLSQSEVNAQIASYRAGGVTHTDTVGTGGGSCPTATPTATPTSPSPTPTKSPTQSPSPTPTGPVNCSNAPNWTFSGVYLTGDKVKHEKSANGNPNGPPSGQGVHLWRAKWWTQGSEPGWTANWEDLGRC